MAVFSGCFWALGTGISNAGVFQECTTYTRPAVSTTGTVLSGLTQNVAQITGPTGPVGGTITKGAIFDSLTGGNCLAYWDWTLLTAVPANFLAITVNIQFNTQLQTALNLALIGGQGSSGSLLDAGAQVGTLNGQPMIAGNRLNIAAGGNLTMHAGSGQWIGSAEVQNLLTANTFAGGATSLTATPGSSQTGATVLSGFMNNIAVVATTADSVILPPLSQAPVGSMLFATNSAANSVNVYPDVGAKVNAVATNGAFAMATTTRVMFLRTGNLTWITLPLVAS